MASVESYEAELAAKKLEGGLIWKSSRKDVFFTSVEAS